MNSSRFARQAHRPATRMQQARRNRSKVRTARPAAKQFDRPCQECHRLVRLPFRLCETCTDDQLAAFDELTTP